MPINRYIEPELRDKFEFHNYGHALEILTTNFQEEWNDITECLKSLNITTDEIKTAGGNKSPIPAKFDDFLFPRGWTETKITADLLVKKMDREKQT